MQAIRLPTLLLSTRNSILVKNQFEAPASSSEELSMVVEVNRRLSWSDSL